MKYFCILILLFGLIPLNSQDNLKQTISERHNLSQEHLDSFSSDIDELKALLKDQQKKIISFESEKNYFRQALNQQTGIFSLIVAAIVSLGGALSYFIINYRNKELRKDLTRLKEILGDKHSEIIILTADIQLVYASTIRNVKNFGRCILPYLKSSVLSVRGNDLDNVYTNLQLTLNTIKKDILHSELQIAQLKNDMPQIEIELKKLISCKNEKISDISFEIATEIKAIKNKQSSTNSPSKDDNNKNK